MIRPSILLHDFQSHRAENHLAQDAVREWIVAAHAQSEFTLHPKATEAERASITQQFRTRIERFGCGSDRIASRNSALDDFTHTDWDRMRIFQLNRYPSGSSAHERGLFYREISGLAFDRFYAQVADPPPVLIHVTCTGYVSPSAAQRLVAGRNWGRSTEVIHAYHMGCYASLPAIRMAAGFAARGKGRVDIVHTEYCTLHMDPSQHLPEQLVVQTLFSDGVIRYSASPTGTGIRTQKGLELIATQEEILPDTEDDMTWMASGFGMEMTLSRKVPAHIRAGLGGFLDRMAAAAEMTSDHLCEIARFAIHPGGPRIIDEVADHLGLRAEQVQASNSILKNYGNMSSATLPHVWEALLEDDAILPGTWIVSLAFGPGLTISGAIFRKTG